MKKILSIFAIMFSIVLFTNCSENDDTPAITSIDFVGFESDFQIGVDPTGNASSEVKVAVSQASGSDRTFNIAVIADETTADPSAYSVPSSVTIPANSTVGAFTVDVVGPNVNSSGDDVVTVQITTDEAGLFKSDPISLNLKQVCPQPELILDITFDQYPEEVYWRIRNASDETVFQSVTSNGDDPWGTYDGATEGANEIKAICLPSGTYTFAIFDKFQDGGGPFSLTINGEVVYSNDGAYAFTTSTMFTIP